MAAAECDAIVADAAWHAHRVDRERSEIVFVRIERAAHRSMTFLEEKYFPPNLETRVLPLAAVAESAARLTGPAPRFIFHSSMATSTLLARVFDCPGASMTLAEPIILNELSALASRGVDVRSTLATVLKLLARPFAEGEVTVIKPGNTANNLMPLIAAAEPGMRAVAIEAPMDDFLRSVAKKGMFGRIVYRRLYAFISRTGALPTGFSAEDVWEQTDLQIAGMAWLMQHAEFVAMLERFPERVRSLTSKDFLASKAGAIDALAAHFGIKLDGPAIADGPVFKTHSKELGRAFDETVRQTEYAMTDEAYGEEIGMVRTWLESVAAHVKVPMVLPNPLLAS